MDSKRCCRIFAGFLLMAMPAFASPKSVTSHHRTHASLKHSTVGGRRGARSVGRSASVPIPPERATAIQTALIKQGYLSGEPTGAWDAQTVSAMEKLQADNGWQSRITPDARALIKLGLGPETQHEEVQAPPQ